MVGVAQLVVRSFVTAVVAGSSPVAHPKLSRARLAARTPPSQGGDHGFESRARVQINGEACAKGGDGHLQCP